jgi:SAM-dependent methyltransferase
MEQPPQTQDPREAAQIAYWNDRTAANWTTLQARIDPIFAPITALALRRAAVQPGERVLDVGCGCGDTVLQLARLVGPRGHVLGVDVSAPMSAHARERIVAAGIAHAEIVVADAAKYDFPPAERDVVFSRFGVMFFADPVAAFGNLRRATRSSGRLLWVVWRALAENPWFAVPLEATLPLLPPASPGDPNNPGPFALADPDRVRRLLEAAGWRNTSFERHDLSLRLAAADEAATAAEITTWMGPLARRLAPSTDAGMKSAVLHAIADALQDHVTDDGIVLTAAVWIVSANA